MIRRNQAAAGRRSRRREEQRRGVEIVELAFALPVMSVIIFGTLELCEVNFTKQSLAVAAYEAGRLAGRPNTSSAVVEARFVDIVAARRVNDVTLTIDPAEISDVAVGDQIRITATAPVSANSTTSLVLSGVPDIVEEVVVIRE